MRSTRRTGVLAIAASLALTAGALTVVVPASAGTAANPGTQTEGQLTLKAPSVGDGEVAFSPLPGQALRPLSNCNLETDGSLLKFSGYIGTVSEANKRPVGFRDGSIGVNELIDPLCNKVDNQSRSSRGLPKTVSETLELALGDSLKNIDQNDMYATSASLDLKLRVSGYLKSPAVIEATLLDTKSSTAAAPVTYTLTQAPTLTSAPSDATLTNQYALGVASEGKFRWNIRGAEGESVLRFDTIRLKAVKGDFSLEGGGEVGTTFELASDVENLIACVPGTTLESESGNAVVEYLGNASSTEGCVAFGVSLVSEDREVVFLKRLDINTTAEFLFTIDWKLSSEANEVWDPEVSLPTTTIDFELNRGPDGEVIPDLNEMPFCPSYLFDEEGQLEGANDADLEELEASDMVVDNVDVPGSEGTQFACIGSRSVSGANGSEFVISDRIYLIGDARMRLG